MVDGLTSSSAAARGILPLQTLIAASMASFSVSHNGFISETPATVDSSDSGTNLSVEGMDLISKGGGNIDALTSSPAFSTTMLRTTFCNWRTFPGQA